MYVIVVFWKYMNSGSRITIKIHETLMESRRVSLQAHHTSSHDIDKIFQQGCYLLLHKAVPGCTSAVPRLYLDLLILLIRTKYATFAKMVATQ